MAEIIVDKLQGGHLAFLGELPCRYGQNNILSEIQNIQQNLEEGS